MKVKAFILFVTILLATFFVWGGCGDRRREVQLVERGGIVYEIDAEIPFTGRAVRYYPDGRKRMESEYRDGRMHGKWTWWYADGRKSAEARWRDGSRHGKRVEWYEDGRKKLEGEYRNGRRLRIRRWDEDGNPI